MTPVINDNLTKLNTFGPGEGVNADPIQYKYGLSKMTKTN